MHTGTCTCTVCIQVSVASSEYTDTSDFDEDDDFDCYDVSQLPLLGRVPYSNTSLGLRYRGHCTPTH